MGMQAPRGDAVQQRIAPYAGRTSLFLFGALALLVANVMLSRNGWQALRAVFPSLPASGGGNQPIALLDLLWQVGLLGGLLLIGSVSDEAGTLALVFLAALWLSFLYNHRALFAGLLPSAKG